MIELKIPIISIRAIHKVRQHRGGVDFKGGCVDLGGRGFKAPKILLTYLMDGLLQYSPRLFYNSQIVPRQRRKYREVLEVKRRLLGELRLADGEPVEVGAGDGQALAVEVAGDGERAVDPTRDKVQDRSERVDQNGTKTEIPLG